MGGLGKNSIMGGPRILGGPLKFWGDLEGWMKPCGKNVISGCHFPVNAILSLLIVRSIRVEGVTDLFSPMLAILSHSCCSLPAALSPV